MGFVAATIATVVVLVLIFVWLNRKYPSAGRSGFQGAGVRGAADQVPVASLEREDPGAVQDDMQQMLRASNALRRRHGAPELTEDDLRDAVAEDEQHRSRGRGPFEPM